MTATPQTRVQGRRAVGTPATVARVEAGEPEARLARGLIEASVARPLARRGDVEAARIFTAARKRASRARTELCETPDGRALAAGISRALSAGGGAPLRAAQRAHVDLRGHAIESAATFVALVREHRLECTAALTFALSSAQWSSLAMALRERAFELGPGILTATRSKDDGDARTTVSLPAFEGMLKIADRASGAARLDLMAALQVQAQSTAERPAQRNALADAWMEKVRERERQEAEARALPVGQPDDEDGSEAEPEDDRPAQGSDGAATDDPEPEPEADARPWNPGSRTDVHAAEPEPYRWQGAARSPDEQIARERAAGQERREREAAHVHARPSPDEARRRASEIQEGRRDLGERLADAHAESMRRLAAQRQGAPS